jgi:hypothetical protein
VQQWPRQMLLDLVCCATVLPNMCDTPQHVLEMTVISACTSFLSVLPFGGDKLHMHTAMQRKPSISQGQPSCALLYRLHGSRGLLCCWTTHFLRTRTTRGTGPRFCCRSTTRCGPVHCTILHWKCCETDADFHRCGLIRHNKPSMQVRIKIMTYIQCPPNPCPCKRPNC